MSGGKFGNKKFDINPEFSVSDNSELLYDIGVDLNLIVHWRSPPKDRQEEIRRESLQRSMDHKAQLLAHEMVLEFKKAGV